MNQTYAAIGRRLLIFAVVTVIGVALYLSFRPGGDIQNSAEAGTKENRSPVNSGLLKSTQTSQDPALTSLRKGDNQVRTFEVSSRILDLFHVVPMNVESGRLEDDFFETVGIEGGEKKRLVQQAFDGFLRDFGKIEAEHSELVVTEDSSVIRVSPCANAAESCFAELAASLDEVIDGSKTPLAVGLISKQFRNSGAQPIEIAFLQPEGFSSYRLLISHLDESGKNTHNSEVGANLDRPSLSAFKRWTHLSAVLE